MLVFSIVCLALTESVSDLNHMIFWQKKSFDFNHDLNQWLKSARFKSANPVQEADRNILELANRYYSGKVAINDLKHAQLNNTEYTQNAADVVKTLILLTSSIEKTLPMQGGHTKDVR